MDKSNRHLREPAGRRAALALTATCLAALAGLASCDAGGTPAQQELDRNEQLWRTQKITSYAFELQRDCFCPEDVRGPVDIVVRNGEPTSVTYVSNGQPASELFGTVDTVDELFSTLRDAYEGRNFFDQKAESVQVTYHPDLGYPLTIFIDVSQTIADEEQGYTVKALAPAR